jgi:electron transport complex protein RnfG
VYKSRKLIGYCFNTKEITQDVQGYSGPMEILVAINTDFKILNIRILRHTETPEYAAKITDPEFLSQFIGKGPGSGFKVGFDVDAVTHATISCNAVCDILKKSLNHMYKMLSAGPEPGEARYYKVIDEQR